MRVWRTVLQPVLKNPQVRIESACCFQLCIGWGSGLCRGRHTGLPLLRIVHKGNINAAHIPYIAGILGNGAVA